MRHRLVNLLRFLVTRKSLLILLVFLIYWFFVLFIFRLLILLVDWFLITG